MRVSHVAGLYTAKYGVIAGIACALGFLLSLPLSVPLTENIRLFMGESGRGAIAPLIGALGAALIFLVVMLYVRAVLRRFRKISAAEAVRFGTPQEKSKAAKAAFDARDADLMRVVIPIELRDKTATAETAARYKAGFPFATVGVADEYIRQTFGGTMDAIQKASYAAIAATVLLTVLVTLLFMKMLAVKDRHSIAVLKSFGFTGADIKRQYMARSLLVAALGVIIGVILANTLGEPVGALLISSLGATSFHFVVNPFYAYLFAPLLIAVCVLAATLLGIRDIRPLKISEHIKEA
jgi:predicted lysophospholipase L1 biosynthesis ABC-type transport system permease subunit